MANYSGEDKKIVSSSYLFQQIQELYTKFLKLIADKADKDHKHETLDVVSIKAGTYTGGSAELKGTFGINRKADSDIGEYSFAEGYNTTARANYSHAEGYNTTASGKYGSHAEGYYTTASGYTSHAEGGGTTASGSYSHAEGYNTTASESYSHAEGYYTTASGNHSHAEGYRTTASESYSHSEGRNTTASGNCSHAEGEETTASGNCSHAEGGNTTASESYSHAEGEETTASGSYSHAEGSNTTASGNCSHAEGGNTTASGNHSHAEGYRTTASGNYSHAEGYNTTASNFASHVSGKHNTAMTTGGSDNNITGIAFVIGNGTSSYALSNAFSVQYSGVVKAKSTITASTTADYAEFFEWLDENKNSEDRVGYFVTLDGDKIKIASNKDDYILGVVSGEPFVLGNGDCDTWNGMYLHDEFRRTIYEPAPKMIEIEDKEEFEEEYIDEETGETKTRKVEKVIGSYWKEVEGEFEGTRPKLNPNYDSSKEYVSRFDRPEWSPVGMLGVLAVHQDGTLIVNGYATVDENGIATACQYGDKNSYRVIRVTSDKVAEIIFR